MSAGRKEVTIRDEVSAALAVKYAWRFVGRWYKWGGDDPAGFDCSGFVGELLQATGRLHTKFKMNAAQIWELYKGKTIPRPIIGSCMVVMKDETVVHIEFCIDDNTSIGASGGSSKTLTEGDAVRDNAFIKPRPIYGRWGKDYTLRFFDPFQED